ncbi:MAG: tetratricopeptide repeat protein, partial [Gammaproteobacteria bacterium]|nr:tetratricopeptide repeat protein [Gammaproteobacteria bacterium]
NLLKIRIGQYGQEHPKVVEIDSLLGVAYGRLGDYKKRKFIQEQTLKSLKSIHANEPNHPEVIKATAELAISCGKIGEYHRRVELLEEALKEQIALKGDKDPDTLRYQGNLANAYGKLGAHEKRHKLLKATLDEQEKIYEPSDPLLAKTYNSYGNACGKLDDHEQRKVYLEKALAIQTKALGEKHQKTAKTLHNLANNYGNLNNQEKRIELLQQVAKVYPRNHPRQATILADLGDALGKIGEYDKGAKSLLQAIEIQKQRFGETHPKLIKTSIDLAKVYLAQERLYKAQKILQETIIIIEQCKESPKINEQKAKAKKILATITERITQILSGKSGCAQNADASSTMEHNQGQEITPPALMPQ